MLIMSQKMSIFIVLTMLLFLEHASGEDNVLSRRKRYLLFPEGTSLQLVYELAIPTLHRWPYTMSWTIGTAWELPTDARDILEKIKPVRPTDPPPPPPKPTPPPHHFHDFDWSYYGPSANGPPMAVQDSAGKRIFFGPFNEKQYNAQKHYMYSSYSNNKGFAKYWKPNEIQLHRRHRRNMFLQLEPFLLSAGLGGRSCILRALCEASQRSSNYKKGSFREEILRVLFTLPQEAEGEDTFTSEGQNDIIYHYDTAFAANGNCEILYSGCPVSLFEIWSST